ncbi:MAG TPA: hypothetical protein VF263_21545 [Longimicrobiaceae bacterium]
MTPLARVFTVKLAVTVLFWAGPLLLAPKRLLAAAGLPWEAVPLARLLGCAYVALCVGYGFGLREVRAGRRATSAVAVGIASNAGAGAYLTYSGVTGAWAGWHPAFRVALWASTATALGIALGLYWFGMRDDGTPPPRGA